MDRTWTRQRTPLTRTAACGGRCGIWSPSRPCPPSGSASARRGSPAAWPTCCSTPCRSTSIYVRLADLAGEGAVEVVRSKHAPPPPTSRRCRAALAPLLGADQTEPPATIPDPFGAGTLHVAVTRFGVGDDHGVLVAGSRNADFPTEQDRLLLGVGANQTAIVVQRRRAEEQVHEQREWLRVTLASIGDAVIATDTEGRVTFLNAVAEALTGWTHGGRRGQAAGGGVPHRQRADPPAGREPGRRGCCGRASSSGWRTTPS